MLGTGIGVKLKAAMMELKSEARRLKGRGASHVESTVARVSSPQLERPFLLNGAALTEAVHAVPGAGLIYINNAKAGCSSVKSSLWAAQTGTPPERPHDKPGSPFAYGLEQLHAIRREFPASAVFTVVRNPYVRALSAYIDKIKLGQNTVAAARFRKQFDLPEMGRPEFSDFLKLLSQVPPETLDQHFAPQFYTTYFPLIRYDFIGQLERMDAVWDWLAARDVAPQEFRSHARDAAGKMVNFYTSREYDLVREIYARDFEVFGYSDDPQMTEAVREIALPDVPATNLMDLITLVYDRGQGSTNAKARMAASAPEIQLI